jgi:3-oxoacyl-[acyl-carrier protein] reductase
LITGGSRGIGLAAARLLLDRGCRLTITGRDTDALSQAAEQLDMGERLHTVAGKVGDAVHRDRAIAETLERFGSLDILVNNAGTNPYYGPLIDAPEAAVSKTLQTNLVSPLLWAQASCRGWMSQHGGVIVNVSSVGGLIPSPMIGV